MWDWNPALCMLDKHATEFSFPLCLLAVGLNFFTEFSTSLFALPVFAQLPAAPIPGLCSVLQDSFFLPVGCPSCCSLESSLWLLRNEDRRPKDL